MFFFFFFITSIILFGVLILTAFLTYLVRHSNHSAKVKPKRPTASFCAVLGSGGHTTEMLELIRHFGEEFNERTYIIADTDTISEDKATAHENLRGNKNFRVVKIPRSREVGQSYFSSIFSTLNSSAVAFQLLYEIRPDLVLLNGPGTCIPVAVAAAFFDMIRLVDTVIVYEESICRVHKLSLSGAILYYTGLVDSLIVQWPALKKLYPRSTYINDLVPRATKS